MQAMLLTLKKPFVLAACAAAATTTITAAPSASGTAAATSGAAGGSSVSYDADLAAFVSKYPQREPLIARLAFTSTEVADLGLAS